MATALTPCLELDPGMNMRSITILLFSLSMSPTAASVGAVPPIPTDQDQAPRGTFVDLRDGRAYAWVRIGTQVWMAENLAFRTPSGSWCYEDDEARCREYGRLYDWETAQTACPQGWRVPSREDWQLFIATLGPDSRRKVVVGGESGFEGKLAGDRYYDGRFRGLGEVTHFWANAKFNDDHAHEAIILPNHSDLHVGGYGTAGAASVRCLRVD
jgi:uncharacterized protein (TIGR02145 family)